MAAELVGVWWELELGWVVEGRLGDLWRLDWAGRTACPWARRAISGRPGTFLSRWFGSSSWVVAAAGASGVVVERVGVVRLKRGEGHGLLWAARRGEEDAPRYRWRSRVALALIAQSSSLGDWRITDKRWRHCHRLPQFCHRLPQQRGDDPRPVVGWRRLGPAIQTLATRKYIPFAHGF